MKEVNTTLLSSQSMEDTPRVMEPGIGAIHSLQLPKYEKGKGTNDFSEEKELLKNGPIQQELLINPITLLILKAEDEQKRIF
jgi:hypothetical protein